MELFSRILEIKCILKKLFYKIFFRDFIFYKDLRFRNGFFIKIKLGKVVIGKRCFFNNYCSINSLGYIEIGDNCIFGEGVKIYDHNHKYVLGKLIVDSGYSIGKVIIKNNVWIGSNVTILKDVVIGNNVVIGANCLIYKDIPDNSLVLSEGGISIKKLK